MAGDRIRNSRESGHATLSLTHTITLQSAAEKAEQRGSALKSIADRRSACDLERVRAYLRFGDTDMAEHQPFKMPPGVDRFERKTTIIGPFRSMSLAAIDGQQFQRRQKSRSCAPVNDSRWSWLSEASGSTPAVSVSVQSDVERSACEQGELRSGEAEGRPTPRSCWPRRTLGWGRQSWNRDHSAGQPHESGVQQPFIILHEHANI
ncbi:hypothetical protein L1887_62726 [Cichorium endivia]|nr:hypothetical protein L1887_62726 [Cichorium endivia]